MAAMRRLLPGNRMARPFLRCHKARVFFLALAGFGCTQKPAENLGDLHRQLKSLVEAGDYVHASEMADHGSDVAVRRHDPVFEWRFRLLKAEVLLANRRAEAALPVLDGELPATREFQALAAERLLLQARAMGYLRRSAEAEALLQRAGQTAHAAQAQDVLTSVEIARGLRLESEGRSRESEHVLLGALEMARTAGSAYNQGAILVNLGVSK